jgi:HPr kinase/phosphorylase
VDELPETGQIIHATTVCVEGRALVILGSSGSGKSSLALQLMAYGAMLVADDRTQLVSGPSGLLATCPSAIKGMVEARGIGILKVPFVEDVPVHLAVDLEQTAFERLPQDSSIKLLGHSVPCLHKSDSPHFAAALLLSLKNVQPKRND